MRVEPTYYITSTRSIGDAVGDPTRKILIVRREGRAMKHEENRSTNGCIKGYRKAFVGSTCT
jgi:hypothetical protein